MGAGASTGVQTALEAASQEDVTKALQSLSSEEVKKLSDALGKAAGGAAAGAAAPANTKVLSKAVAALTEAQKANVVKELGSDDIAAALGALEKGAKLEKIKKMGGACCDDWVDLTCCASDDEIHAPRYFKDYSDFSDQINAMEGEFGLKMFLTKELYDKYKDDPTKLGVTLDKMIKGGIDTVDLGMGTWNAGKVGLLFGDGESVTKYSELVDPIMKWRHNDPKLPHPASNFDGDKLLDHTALIDEKYVISTRVRTGRSIDGFTLSPCISANERKKLEGLVVPALLGLADDLKGDYFPLAGSDTYEPKKGGIDKETEQRLISDRFLFQEPHDEPMLLSWRMERNWPHARGIYHNEAKNALVWINEEDHLRIISMEQGFNIRAVFDRFGKIVNAVEAACKAANLGFVVDKNYGNICGCPSNCGTGLRGSMMIKIPLSSKKPDFKEWCAKRNLQARGSSGFASKAADDGIRDVSNCDRMGKDEVTLVNEMIQGVADLIKWEKELEKAA